MNGPNAFQWRRELFASKGYICVSNPIPKRYFYQQVYDEFDRLIDECVRSRARQLQLDRIAALVKTSPTIAARYSEEPFSIRNLDQAGDKSTKFALQLCASSAQLLMQIGQRDWRSANRLGFFANELIVEIIRTFDGILRPIGFHHGNNFGVVLRIQRYEGNGMWGTPPHIDRSVLSLLLHSSDDLRGVMVVPPDRKTFDMAEAQAAQIVCDDFGNPLTSVLLPGAYSAMAGLYGIASPHAVNTLDLGQRRHSVVAFLVPPVSNLAPTATDVPMAGGREE